ncbi:MAG: hypothetical protein MI976_16850 [Pseudomonadales bacterium]|nr:hypothetical protein [Pseudomonadales bacterium]
MKKLTWLVAIIISIWIGSYWPILKGHLAANYFKDGISLAEALDIGENEEFNFEAINFNGYELLHVSSDKTNSLYVLKDNKLLTLSDDHMYIGSLKPLGGCSIDSGISNQYLAYDFVDLNNNFVGSVFDFGRDGIADSRINFETNEAEISIDSQWFKVVKEPKSSAINSKGEVQSYARVGNKHLWQ